MSVYNDNGGFTEIAQDLSKELKTVIEPVLVKYMDKGMTIEEISYIVHSASDKIFLRNQVEKRINSKNKI